MHCGVCGAETLGSRPFTRYRDRKEQYYRCPFCSALYLYPLPEQSDHLFFRDPDNTRKLENVDEERGDYFETRLKWLEKNLQFCSGSSRLLEVGCGTGTLLRAARQRGWQVEGVELSPELSEIARRNNPGVTIHQGDFIQIQDIPPHSFHTLVALDVLEHLISPRDFLLHARRLLKSDGLILLQTPNLRSLRYRTQGVHWNMLIPDYHYHLFHEAILSRLLRWTGFQVVWIRTVSGTGREQGVMRLAARIRESLLSPLRLGNALVVLAKVRG